MEDLGGFYLRKVKSQKLRISEMSTETRLYVMGRYMYSTNTGVPTVNHRAPRHFWISQHTMN